MKRLHIVEPYHSAAMHRMSKPLIDALPAIYEVTTGEAPDLTADLNYHIPWHTLAGLDKGVGKHAMLYTHCNPGAEPDLIDACERADLIICMSFTGRRELLDLGVDRTKIWVIYASGGAIPMRKRNVGVIGFEQPNGRKRSHILIDLAWQLNCPAIHFVIVGGGWDDTVAKMRNAGASVDYFPDLPDDQIPAVYNALDLLLVTGYIEGGPLTVLEALSAGVPVLAPKVGYAADLFGEGCHYSDVPDLVKTLQEFAKPSLDRASLSHLYTWQEYANEHALVFGRLLSESVELDPRNGAARYAQLLDIIRDNNIEFICEIGTWNGANAVRMIQEAQKHSDDVDYAGYDLFESMTPELFKREFSKWPPPESVVYQRIKATGVENCGINAGDTNNADDTWNEPGLYFIDGGHSEKTILNDWNMVRKAAESGAIVVFDDYYHDGKPKGMGCNTLIDILDSSVVWNVEHLPVRTQGENGLVIGMVKVTRADIPVL